MAEYIEREDLIEKISSISVQMLGFRAGKSLLREAMKIYREEFLKCIEEAPIADVVEVKHGEWYLLKNCANEGVYCSVCTKKVYKTDYANQKIKSPFCPNCGAKMDKKAGAEE